MLEAEHSWNNGEMEKLWLDLPVKIEMNRLQVEHYKKCVFLFQVSRPKMAELAIEMEKLAFKLSDVQKGRCHILEWWTLDTSQNSGAKSDPKVGPQKKQLKVDKGHNREISWPQRTKQNGGAHVLSFDWHFP